MAKKKELDEVSSSLWDSLEKELGTGNTFFLRDDGESIVFIVKGQPQVMTVKFRKTVRKVGVIPVVTATGAGAISMGQKQFRAFIPVVRKHPDQAYVMTRHGERDNINTTYSFDVEKIPDEIIQMAENYTEKEVEEAARSGYESMLNNAIDG